MIVIANSLRIILLFIVFLLILFPNVAIANQSINFSLSPSHAYVDETTTFTIEFTSSRNLSNAVMYFYVDSEKKGAKNIFNIEKNKTNYFIFDCFFDKNSYSGEHYFELHMDLISENQEKNNETFYTVINVDKREKLSNFFNFVIFLMPILIALPLCFFHQKYSKKSIIKFERNERKALFNFLITVLPISTSLFTLSFSEKSELKFGMLSIITSFIISFILALIMFKAESWAKTDANHFAFYSLSFLLLALIEMIVLVLIFF